MPQQPLFFNATVGTAPSADTKCEPGLLKNTANVSADSLKPLTDSANVNKQCQPQKVTCDNLQAISLGNRSFFSLRLTILSLPVPHSRQLHMILATRAVYWLQTKQQLSILMVLTVLILHL